MDKTYTYTDYVTWDGHWELINGKAYNMSPAPSTKHQNIVGELYFALRSFLGKDGCKVFVAPFDIRFSLTGDYEHADTVVQPDISVICNKQQIDDKGGKGSPDLVIEVLSPATALKDRNQKLKLYETHGVQEYWIVDPLHATIEVHKRVDNHFAFPIVFGSENTLTSFLFPNLSIELATIFNTLE